MYKNYNMKQVTLSLDLEIYLEKNDIAFAINELVESIPSHVFSIFDHQVGTSSYDPIMMLKLILCGYTQSNFSGRKIEAMTKDSIRTRWLTQSQFPNFRTINRFRVNPLVQPILQECFIQFRNQLVSQKLIEEDAIFIDGTKLEANANKYSFVWRKSTTRFADSLTEKSKTYYKQLVKEKIIPSIHNEDEEWDDKHLTLIADSIETKVSELTEQIDTTEDVTLRKELRRQRKEPKKALKAFREFSDRKKKYKQQYQIFKERNSFSKIDMDATFMRMKEDHMMNGQLKPAYNVQIATNNQYILAYDIFSNPTDFKTMIPFLTTIKESYFELPNYIVADAGYGSEENYQAILDDFERTPLITYTMYQKEQTKKYNQNPFITNNWKYNELTDSYTCPNNRELHFRNYSTRNDKYGFTRQLKMYECESCLNCPVRALCTRAKSNKSRVIQKNGNWEYFKAHARELLSDDMTGAIYRRRKIDVEPAFGNLKANLAFNRFLVRGQEKVTQELGFAFMALNLRKLSKFRKDIDRKIRKNKNSKMINLILEFLFCFKRLLGHPHQYFLFISLWFLFMTGIRVGKATAIQWEDIDFDTGILSIDKTLYYKNQNAYYFTEPKTRASIRKIILDKTTLLLLKNGVTNNKKITKTRYVKSYKGIPTQKHTFSYAIDHFSKKAYIHRIRIQELRHSHASFLISMGENPLIIKERLGHEDIQTKLGTYGHLYPNSNFEVADKLNGIIDFEPAKKI